MCVYITYIHIRTTNEEEAMNLKENKKGHIGRLEAEK